jgi:large subunit ribosomal protein L3
MIDKIPAKKIGMTTMFDKQGFTVPVTLVQPFELVVTEIKSSAKHGYNAVQLAYRETLAKRVNKPQQGVLKKSGTSKVLAKFYESRQDAIDGLTLGQEIAPGEFASGWAKVKVSGVSKGKGFAGGVKRWGFAGQQRTHGDPDNRRSMSNNSTDPARVFKGSRRAGHMGAANVSVRGLKIAGYNPELNLLAIKGGLPGPVGSTVFLSVMELAKTEGGE